MTTHPHRRPCRRRHDGPLRPRHRPGAARVAAGLLAPALLLAGCTNEALVRRVTGLEQRVERLEAQVVDLQQAPPSAPVDAGQPPTPSPARAAILEQIRRLETDKARLLGRYTPQHPSVVDLDRQIQRLQEQLRSAPR